MRGPQISMKRLNTLRDRVLRFLDRGGGVHLPSLRGLGRRAFRGEPSLFFALVPLPLPLRRTVVADAALVRFPTTVKVRAAEGAAERLTPKVARVNDEEDPAMPTPGE
jgi:hypothetical protein